MSKRTYVVTMDAVAQTATKILAQIVAGASNPLEIIKATITQEDITTSDQSSAQILRMTAAATVTAFTPVKFNSNDSAASTTTGTGTNASTAGTEGDILVSEGFNLLTGFMWTPSFDEERIIVPASGIVALKLNTAPASSTTFSAQFLFAEL